MHAVLVGIYDAPSRQVGRYRAAGDREVTARDKLSLVCGERVDDIVHTAGHRHGRTDIPNPIGTKRLYRMLLSPICLRVSL